MASTGINNGTLVGLYKDGTLITHLTSNSISFSMATRDATSKDSGGNEYVLEALKSAEMACEGYIAEDAAVSFEDLYDEYDARTAFTALISSEVSGDISYSASVYITSLEMNAPLEDSMTFSCSLKVTGPITKAAVT